MGLSERVTYLTGTTDSQHNDLLYLIDCLMRLLYSSVHIRSINLPDCGLACVRACARFWVRTRKPGGARLSELEDPQKPCTVVRARCLFGQSSATAEATIVVCDYLGRGRHWHFSLPLFSLRRYTLLFSCSSSKLNTYHCTFLYHSFVPFHQHQSISSSLSSLFLVSSSFWEISFSSTSVL